MEEEGKEILWDNTLFAWLPPLGTRAVFHSRIKISIADLTACESLPLRHVLDIWQQQGFFCLFILWINTECSFAPLSESASFQKIKTLQPLFYSNNRVGILFLPKHTHRSVPQNWYKRNRNNHQFVDYTLLLLFFTINNIHRYIIMSISFGKRFRQSFAIPLSMSYPFLCIHWFQ